METENPRFERQKVFPREPRVGGRQKYQPNVKRRTSDAMALQFVSFFVYGALLTPLAPAPCVSAFCVAHFVSARFLTPIEYVPHKHLNLPYAGIFAPIDTHYDFP